MHQDMIHYPLLVSVPCKGLCAMVSETGRAEQQETIIVPGGRKKLAGSKTGMEFLFPALMAIHSGWILALFGF